MKPRTIQKSSVLIRPAKPKDAAEIANVHVHSWREAYRGLLPQTYLDELPTTFKRRVELWKRLTVEDTQAVFVADAPCGIVGFACFGQSRDKALVDHGELSAIYLLEKFQGQGLGAALLQLGMDKLQSWEFTKAYCWVLDSNPTIRFYEKSGAVFNGMEKTEEIGGQTVTELAYVWNRIQSSI